MAFTPILVFTAHFAAVIAKQGPDGTCLGTGWFYGDSLIRLDTEHLRHVACFESGSAFSQGAEPPAALSLGRQADAEVALRVAFDCFLHSPGCNILRCHECS